MMIGLPQAEPQLGLSENWKQFTLLVVINGFVGLMIGAERSLLPVIAETDFRLKSTTAMLTFIMAFGMAKALANFAAGHLAHAFGRRRMLITGWLFALPVPLVLWWAPSWGWVIVANVLLGINQGLAWSATVIMKIDLVGPRRRGFAMGLNEFAGYVAVAGAALLAGMMASQYGARNATVLIASGAAVIGLLLSILFVRDTADHVAVEQREHSNEAPSHGSADFWSLTWKRRPMLAANQAGFINNLNDGAAWGLFPLLFASVGLSLQQVGILAALYPATWGFGQLLTGYLSDRAGRPLLIVTGMLMQAVGLVGFASFSTFSLWFVSALLLGFGTAAVYPTLIAHVSDSLAPVERASGVGVYRLWRDLGYVAGAILTGIVADSFGLRIAIALVALLTGVSGLLSGVLLRKTNAHPSDAAAIQVPVR